MLKRLRRIAIGVGVLILLAAIAFVACKDQHAREENSCKYEQEIHKSIRAVLLGAQNDGGQDQTYKCPDRTPDWQILLAWPNAIETWAIVLTLLALIWQSDQTRRSAKAAARGIELQERSQRAWVVIRSGMEDNYMPSAQEGPRFSWIIKNYGKTPAQIIETQCRYEVMETFALSELADPPDYPLPIPLNGAILVPIEPMYHFTFLEDRRDRVRLLRSLDETQIRALEEGTLWLVAYGYVKYRDGISEGVQESHFIANYVWPKPGHRAWEVGFRPVISAPSEYTKCT